MAGAPARRQIRRADAVHQSGAGPARAAQPRQGVLTVTVDAHDPGPDVAGKRAPDVLNAAVEPIVRFLTDNQLPFVMVDEPQGFKSSVPPVVAVTSPDLVVMRFHGRNVETWEKKGITPAERFQYLYDREQLRSGRRACAALRERPATCTS